MTVRDLDQVLVTMPAPVFTNGRPDRPWTPTLTRSTWGHLKVKFGSTDVSNIRSVPVDVVSYSSTDPFGSERAILRFPQITPFDALGAGDLAAIVPWANVDILRVAPGGESTLWEGLISGFDWSQDDKGASLTVTCLGALHQLLLYVRAPGDHSRAVDLAVAIANEFALGANRPGLRTLAMIIDPAGNTGITTRNRGMWQNAFDYVLELLATATTNSGTDQWTVAHDWPRQPALRMRDRTTVNHVVTAGQPGLTLDLHRDYLSASNCIYGEWIDQAGSRGRNTFVPTNKLNADRTVNATPTGNVFFNPLSVDSDIDANFNEGTSAFTDSTDLDTSKVRIERFIHFGEQIERSEAKDMADQYRQRDRDPGYNGRLTLRMGGETSDHREIRAGQNIKLKYFAGTGSTGILAHIASSEVSRNGDIFETVLTVDTKARDLLALEEIIRRRREGTTPGRRLMTGRDSRSVRDDRTPWDAGAGAGVIPYARHLDGTSTVSLTANTWHVEKFLASEFGTIEGTHIACSSGSARVYLAFFDYKVGTGDLPANPFVPSNWEPVPNGFLVGWGDSIALVGGLNDDTQWTFDHSRGEQGYPNADGDVDNSGSPQFLWLAARSDTTCTIAGTLTKGGD